MGVCVACGTTNPDGFRFCGACAGSLAESPGVGPREERKTVTVLFADLAGFTARSDGADPEDVRALVRPFHEILRHEAGAFGGTLARIVGDAGMVVFGYPQAHEDDPERAVRAGLAILEALGRRNDERPGLDLHARIGINTSEAVVTYGSRLEDADDLMGDGVNVAARLQAAAPVDAVVAGEATYRATAGVFRWEELPPVVAKGKAEPVLAWRPLARLARSDGTLYPETTLFVGRSFELESLVRLFERARSTPSLEVVTIVADPGIGKSRLVRELARYVEALPDLVVWRVGRCLPYGDGISFWALGEIVKAHAGILETDDQVTISARLDAVLGEPNPGLRAWTKDRLGPLVGLRVASEPPQQEEAFTAWRRFLESIARVRPMVMIVEDLHWADDALVAFLGHLTDNTAGLPILLVVTARPEVEDRHPTWHGPEGRSAVMALESLEDADMAALIEMAVPGASPALVATILERAAGSPLYAEQLGAMFRDRLALTGAGSPDPTSIPPSLHALLASRIDALPPAAKAVLLDASVVGKTFWSGAVEAISGRGREQVAPLLAELTRRKLVRSVTPSSMAGDPEYAFVHALVRDVAYAELPRVARLASHRVTAAWITERDPDRLGEAAEIVAAHLERALELAGATRSDDIAQIGEDLVRAILAAADGAERTDVLRAQALLRRALGVLPAGDERRPAVLVRLGLSLRAASEAGAAASAFEEATAIFRARGDDMAVARLAPSRSWACFATGRGEQARAILDEAKAFFGARAARELIDILVQQGLTSISSNRDERALERSLRLGEEALGIAESLGLVPSYATLTLLGSARAMAGDRGGLAILRSAIEAAVAEGRIASVVNLYDWLGDMTSVSVSSSEAITIFDEGITFAQAHGVSSNHIRTSRIETLYLAGLWDEMAREVEIVRPGAVARGDAYDLVVIDRARMIVRLERGDPDVPATALMAQANRLGLTATRCAAVGAEAALAQGEHDEAARILAEALDATPAHGVETLAAVVRASVRAGQLDVARRALEIGTIPCALFLAEEVAAHAMLAEATGEQSAARLGYEEAVRLLTGLGYLPELAYALAGLGRRLLALGETAEGRARLGESRMIWDSLRATPRIAEIDALLGATGAGQH
jgi:class 3 adenylate cyclase